MRRKLKCISNITDVIVTTVQGKLESTPFYIVLETKGEVVEISSLFVNDKQLPKDLLRFVYVRKKRFQFYFSSDLAKPEDIQEEKIKEVEIDKKAQQLAHEKIPRFSGAEVLQNIGLSGRTYHLLPHSCGGTICATSDQLELFHLHKGENIMKIRVSLRRESTRGVKTRDVTLFVHIWYFSSDVKMVISDVDGTITKHEFRHWVGMSNQVHKPILEKYQDYQETGHQFVYITMRPFATNDARREFLHRIGAPDGVILTCPLDFRGILRAYVGRCATKLKLIHLYYLRSMFPESSFHAAFGNTPQDAQVYRTIVPTCNRIFNVQNNGSVGDPLPSTSVMTRAFSMINFLLGSTETDSSDEDSRNSI